MVNIVVMDVSYEVTILWLDVKGEKLNKIRAQSTTMCPPRTDKLNIRPNLLQYFIS